MKYHFGQWILSKVLSKIQLVRIMPIIVALSLQTLAALLIRGINLW